MLFCVAFIVGYGLSEVIPPFLLLGVIFITEKEVKLIQISFMTISEQITTGHATA